MQSACSTSPPAVTRLTVYRWLHIWGRQARPRWAQALRAAGIARQFWEAVGGFIFNVCVWKFGNVEIEISPRAQNFMETCLHKQTSILGHFRAQGSALTRNVSRSHGSKNLLQRVRLYRHEKILLGREDCRPGPKKTMWANVIVFH